MPRALVWDNESGVGQWRAGRPQLTESMNAFRGTLGIKVIQCRPADPEAKGLVERARAESWTHEEFLAACLQREVADLHHPGQS